LVYASKNKLEEKFSRVLTSSNLAQAKYVSFMLLICYIVQKNVGIRLGDVVL